LDVILKLHKYIHLLQSDGTQPKLFIVIYVLLEL